MPKPTTTRWAIPWPTQPTWVLGLWIVHSLFTTLLYQEASCQIYNIGNIETLYALKGSVLEEIYSYEQVRPGDIFIRGKEGEILGGGHTGIFTRKGEIIHYNAYNSTVTINNEISFIRYYLACHRSAWEIYFSPIGGRRASLH